MRHIGNSHMKQIQPYFFRLTVSSESSLLPSALIQATSTVNEAETASLGLAEGRAHSFRTDSEVLTWEENRLLTPCSLSMRGLRATHTSAKATLIKITLECTDVLKLCVHVAIFMCVPWDDNTAAHKAQAHSLDKSLLTEKPLCDSS